MLVKIGKVFMSWLMKIGDAGFFLGRIIFTPWQVRSFELIGEQIYQVGIVSVPIIVISGLFIGMILGLQGYTILAKFGSVQQLGQVVALAVIRELGPIVGALLFIGRAGSALTAELGLMRTTEQLDSMEIMAVDPLFRVVNPRFWASVFSLPVLISVFCVVAVLGGYLIGVKWLGVDGGQFYANMRTSVDFYRDVLNGILVKPIVFGILSAWIAVYQGFYTKPTADGIGSATTKTVVYSSLVILGADFILTSFMMGGW